MGGKKGTSSSGGSRGHGGGSPGRRSNKGAARVRSVQVKKGKEYVAKEIKKAGSMFGQEASKATDDYLVKTGKVKVGSYFRKEGGNFIRIGKEEGERLYASGDPSISRSTSGDTKSKELKYGKSGSAMGSGDPTGIMTSTAISQPMHKRQQKIKALTLAALSFAAPLGASALLRTAAMTSYGQMGQKGYDQYLSKFYSNMAGTTSSYGVKSKTTGNGKEKEVSSANITETRTDTKKSLSNETRFTSLKAVTSGGGTVTEADRTLMKRSGKTIKASTVST
jgi:hypothetical protein